jgi:tRNA pseudouridine38-40 synthase
MRLAMVVAYDGTGFHGFARQDGVETVQGALERALGRIVQADVATVGAGRTDAGVHAWGQVVTVEVPGGAPVERLQAGCNSLLAPAVVVRSVEVVADDFDARRSATWRAYRYTILNRPVPDPFLAATTWWVPQPLDLAALRLGCDPLIGEHDFAAFCRRPDPRPGGAPRSLVRRVLDARWLDLGDGLLRFEVRATSFCHQMVRSLVGTLVDVGSGRRTAGEVSGILRARDRQAAGPVAPPHGLCLWEVGYP